MKKIIFHWLSDNRFFFILELKLNTLVRYKYDFKKGKEALSFDLLLNIFKKYKNDVNLDSFLNSEKVENRFIKNIAVELKGIPIIGLNLIIIERKKNFRRQICYKVKMNFLHFKKIQKLNMFKYEWKEKPVYFSYQKLKIINNLEIKTKLLSIKKPMSRIQ